MLRRLLRSNSSRVLISDLFIDPTGTNLANHLISPINRPATAWTNRNSSAFQIMSNKAGILTVPAGQPKVNATLDAGVSDYIITCTINYGNAGSSSPGIITRYAVTDNVQYLVVISDSTNEFSIYEWNGSTFTSRATTTIAIAANTSYALVITCQGSTITATLDGANQISYASATVNQSSTLLGMRDSESSNNTWSNFTVSAPP